MKKKILIVGLAQSTHTHSWIDLIDKDEFEVRLFGVNNTKPGAKIDAYCYTFSENFPFITKNKFSFPWINKFRKMLFIFSKLFLEDWWLKTIIKNWKPDIVHTLGLDSASFRFIKIKTKFKLSGFKWVVTIRGGSDIELERFKSDKKILFRKIFKSCDKVLADNKLTYKYAEEFGLKICQKPNFEFVPGTGGMNIKYLSSLRKKKTSLNRTILWPKACEAVYSKGLPVLEALKIAWPQIQPCRVIMTVVDRDFKEWLNALPFEIRQSIEVYNRVDRTILLNYMANSRVVLLPSLIDGIPNSLYEAMACQTCAIVSPLETIKTIISKKEVLFARNLFPNEIAKQLIRAMNDNSLVDRLTKNSLSLVKVVANREKIIKNINHFYEELVNDK